MGKPHRRPIAAHSRIGILFLFVTFISFAALTVFVKAQAQNTAPNNSGGINALAFADAQHGIAVGSGGLLQRTEDGINWNRIESPLLADLTGVAFADAQHGMIVGRNTSMSVAREIVSRTTDGGRTWRNGGDIRGDVSVPGATVPLQLAAISYPDAQHARAVGETTDGRGAFLITNDGGQTWQRLPTNSDNALRGVSFVDANTGWVVGERGTILHTTDAGTTWKLQGEREDTTDHRGVFFLNAQRGWIVSTRGGIRFTTNGGETWERRDVRTTSDLINVRFRNERQGAVLASDGNLLTTNDGGASWQTMGDGMAVGTVKAFALRPDGSTVVALNTGQFAVLQTQSTESGVAGTSASGASPGASPSPGTDTAAAQPTPGQRSVRERVREMPMTADRFIGLLGIVVLLGMCYLASNNRRAIDWRLVIVGLLLQVGIAVLILKTDTGYAVFDWLGQRVNDLLTFSNEGAKFVFGRLVDTTYLDAVAPAGGEQDLKSRFGFIFAFTITATIIFVASLFSILYHLGVMQRVVFALAWGMKKTMKSISGAEALTVAAEVFMGQTEAPLTIAPYIPRLTKSELLAMMIGGMGTVSGGILAVYVSFGIDPVFLLTTSVMSAPACLLIAKMLYPETEVPETAGSVRLTSEKIDANIIDATARGAGEGLRLALNVMAVLIAFIALVAMVNAVLGWAGGWLGINALLNQPFSLQVIFGYLFAPLAFVMGVPWADAVRVGDLLGTKLVLNEVVAYVKLAAIQEQLNPRSILIATFALCGFANIASVGIIIGGIGGLAPERRSDLARLGWRALFGGFLATCLTATLAGLLS